MKTDYYEFKYVDDDETEHLFRFKNPEDMGELLERAVQYVCTQCNTREFVFSEMQRMLDGYNKNKEIKNVHAT